MEYYWTRYQGWSLGCLAQHVFPPFPTSLLPFQLIYNLKSLELRIQDKNDLWKGRSGSSDDVAMGTEGQTQQNFRSKRYRVRQLPTLVGISMGMSQGALEEGWCHWRRGEKEEETSNLEFWTLLRACGNHRREAMEVWVARVTDVRIVDMSTRNRTTVRVKLLRERGMSRVEPLGMLAVSTRQSPKQEG